MRIHINFTTLNGFDFMTFADTVNLPIRNFNNKTYFGIVNDYNSQNEIILEPRILKSRISHLIQIRRTESLLSDLLSFIFMSFIMAHYLEPFPEPTSKLDFRFIAQ